MKALLLAAFLGISLLTGCTRRYIITLNNGSQITSKGKPQPQNGGFVIDDGSGQKIFVPGGRVREIAPASMASPSPASRFKPTPQK